MTSDMTEGNKSITVIQNRKLFSQMMPHRTMHANSEMQIGQTTTVGNHNHQKFQYTKSNKEDFLLALPIQAILPTNIP